MITRSVFLVTAAAMCACAQETIPLPPLPPPDADVVTYQAQRAVQGAPAGAPNVMYMRTEIAGGGETVKGSPFSAEAITEFTQTLADGNVIRQKQSGNMYRDSEGRTRREQTLGPIGSALPAPEPAVKLTFISDPVAGVSYVLDSNRKTAEKLPLGKSGVFAGTVRHGMVGTKAIAATPAIGGQAFAFVKEDVMAAPDAQAKQETKVIEGLQAVGGVNSRTIPAGEVGNERPIETSSERWYSPDLQTVIMSRQSDPRMGVTTFRLANINRSEPPHTLFEVPADYTVTEGPSKPFNIMIRKPVEPKDTK